MSRKAKQVVEAEVIETSDNLIVTDVVTPEVEVETIDEVENAEIERLNRVNDIEKNIITHQEFIKSLRAELRKLESKTKSEGPSKMELATELFKNNPGLQRKVYVERFMAELGLTLAGARTYIQLIMKKNKDSQE